MRHRYYLLAGLRGVKERRTNKSLKKGVETDQAILSGESVHLFVEYLGLLLNLRRILAVRECMYSIDTLWE